MALLASCAWVAKNSPSAGPQDSWREAGAAEQQTHVPQNVEKAAGRINGELFGKINGAGACPTSGVEAIRPGAQTFCSVRRRGFGTTPWASYFRGFLFFSSNPFEPIALRGTVPLLRNARAVQETSNTLTALLTEFSDVKISFFGGLTLKRVGEPEWDSKRSVLVASLEDLAAMKVAVIYQRAEARDYLDVAAILKRGIKLSQALSFAQAVYGERFNPLASLKALSYFEDGNLTIAAGTSETDFKQGSRRRNFD